MSSMPRLTLAAANLDMGVIRVTVPDLQYAESPNVLKSDRLGPAIAIGVHDPASRSGLMAITQEFRGSAIEQVRDTVANLYGDSPTLNFHVFGGATSCLVGATRGMKSRLHRWVMQERLYLEVSLSAYYSRNHLEFHWLPQDTDGRLILNTETGEFGHFHWQVADDKP